MKKRITLLLACLLAFSLFACAKKPEESAGGRVETKAVGFSAQYIRTDGYHEEIQYPAVKVLRSKSQLDAYYEANKELYSFDGGFDTGSFKNACIKYDDAYFQDHILVFVLLEEGSGSTRHKVQGVSLENNGELIVEIDTIEPESGDSDMAEWHIMIEPEAGIDVATEEDVTVLLDGKNVTEPKVLAEYSKGYANMSLQIPEGWEYEIEDREGALTFGINFWPAGQTEGKIKVCYYAEMFGVCGTGLSEETVTLGRYTANQGTYDNEKAWDFIALKDTPGDYVILNDGANVWWETYGEKAMEILQSISVGEGCLAEDRALAVARKKCIIEYDDVYSSYDYKTGIWTLTFAKASPYARQEITVDPTGNVGGLIQITQQ